ncbi:MAG: hypothetical protein WB699_03145 [Bacteroidota bacterium]
MLHLPRRKSLGWAFFSWLVLFALVADGANLDDLMPGMYVIHEFGDGFQYPPQSHRSAGGTCACRRLPEGTNHPLRVVSDEDSPSEPTEAFLCDFLTTMVESNEGICIQDNLQASDSLHLLHRTLLI